MDLLTIKNESGLELVVTTTKPKKYEPIFGGMKESPDWDEYLSGYKDEFIPHLSLIKKAIEDLGWVGETAETKANDTFFVFSDGNAASFSWMAWGDLMSAIVGKNEGYMAYYM